MAAVAYCRRISPLRRTQMPDPQSFDLLIERGTVIDGSGDRSDFADESQDRDPDVGAISAELRELLIDSVRLQLRADVPVGAFLSSGIDSTSVVALAREFQRRDPSTTIVFVGTAKGIETKVLAHEGLLLELITAKPVMGKGLAKVSPSMYSPREPQHILLEPRDS